MRVFIILNLLTLLIIAGCNQNNNSEAQMEATLTLEELTTSGLIAKKHLENHSYGIVEYLGEHEYIVTKRDLERLPHSQIWAVQNVDPLDYVDKKIALVQFHVTDHPLNVIETGNVHVSVFIHAGKVIGGTSFIEDHDGAVYFLDGSN